MTTTWKLAIPTMTEREYMQIIIDAARGLGWLCYHTHDSRHSERGFPDLVLCRGDRLLAIEVKREGRDLTPAQQVWCDALERAGAAVYRPVRPSDYDAILEVLR